jgi:hypothetical protein
MKINESIPVFMKFVVASRQVSFILTLSVEQKTYRALLGDITTCGNGGIYGYYRKWM